jgi:UDP-glucose 4-epimerase
VYGKNDRSSLSEDDDAIYGSTGISRWLYAVSKATDEFIALAYAREHGFPVTIARLFNTTGPRQSHAYGMVVPRFVRQALAGEPITVFGDGTQTRCFTNVFDVVESLVRLSETPAAIGQVVNVGRPDEISMLDLASRVRLLCGSRSPVELVDYDQAYGPSFEDMRRRIPDVTRLRQLTGYAPETDLDVTIQQIIDWVLETRTSEPLVESAPRAVRGIRRYGQRQRAETGAPVE